MFHKIIKNIYIMVAFILLGCGSGGNGSNNAGTTANPSDTPVTPPITPQINKITFEVKDGVTTDNHVIYDNTELPIIIKLSAAQTDEIDLSLKNAPKGLSLSNSKIVVDNITHQAKITIKSTSIDPSIEALSFQLEANTKNTPNNKAMLNIIATSKPYVHSSIKFNNSSVTIVKNQNKDLILHYTRGSDEFDGTVNLVSDAGLSLTKSSCVFNATQNDCQINLSANKSGVFNLTPVFSDGKINDKVDLTPISINVLDSQKISFSDKELYLQPYKDQKITLSSVVGDIPLLVNLSVSNKNLTLSTNTCRLSDVNPSCDITINSAISGGAKYTLTAIANDMAVESANLSVYAGDCGKVESAAQAFSCMWDAFSNQVANITNTANSVYSLNRQRAEDSFNLGWAPISLVYFTEYTLNTLYPDLLNFSAAAKTQNFAQLPQLHQKIRDDYSVAFSNQDTSGGAYNMVWLTMTSMNQIMRETSKDAEANNYALTQLITYVLPAMMYTSYNFVATDGVNYLNQAVNDSSQAQCSVYVTDMQQKLQDNLNPNVQFLLSELEPNSLLRWVVYYTSPTGSYAMLDSLDAMYGYLSGKTLVKNKSTTIDICDYAVFQQELQNPRPNMYAVNFNQLVNKLSTQLDKDPEHVYWLLTASTSYLIYNQMNQLNLNIMGY